MADMSEKLFEFGMSPQALSEKVLEDRFGNEMPSIPIDPFKLMREYGMRSSISGRSRRRT